MGPSACLFVASCITVLAALVVAEDIFEPRIVGGHLVRNITEIPFQVSIQTSNRQHFCGGSIIDSQHILTAGHCVYKEKATNLKVVAGNLRLQPTTKHTQVSGVQKIFLHEKYTEKVNDVNNDIAVLRLSQPFTLNAFVRAANLSQTADPPKIQNCMISGWGFEKFIGGKVSNDLQAANVTYIPTKFCNETIYKKTLKPGMICAGIYPQSTKDACLGDSGGPLVCGNSLYGVISWGVNCSTPNYPGVYTNVGYYKTWIQEKRQASSATTHTISIAFVVLTAILTF